MMTKGDYNQGFRSGRFDLQEQAFMRRNAGSLSIEDIADDLNRNIETVKKWIYKQDLLSESDLNPQMSRDTLKQKLKHKAYWKDLSLQFDPDELIYFTECYIDYYIQFKGDVTASEEYTIRQVIGIDILISRSLKERQKHMQEIDRLDKAVRREYNKSFEERDREFLTHLQEQLNFARAAISNFTREHTTLTKESAVFLKQLKATRDQRIDRIENATTTFQGLIRMLHDDKFRRKLGQEAEIMKKAKRKAMDNMMDYHTYCDKQVDNPILTSETIERNKRGRQTQRKEKLELIKEVEKS